MKIHENCTRVIGHLTERLEDSAKGMFIKVQSWDETKKHAEFANVDGKKVRITIEVLE